MMWRRRPPSSSSVGLRLEVHERRQASRRAGIEWLGGVGNACTLATYALCAGIHVILLEGTARGALALCPLMLLLQPHTLPFPSLNTANRYAPVATAAAVTLVSASLVHVAQRATQTDPTAQVFVPVVRGLALAACTAPSLLLCCRFLWTWRQTPPIFSWCALPLNTVPLLLSHERLLYDLGAAGVLASLAHIYIGHCVRLDGIKYV